MLDIFRCRAARTPNARASSQHVGGLALVCARRSNANEAERARARGGDGASQEAATHRNFWQAVPVYSPPAQSHGKERTEHSRPRLWLGGRRRRTLSFIPLSAPPPSNSSIDLIAP